MSRSLFSRARRTLLMGVSLACAGAHAAAPLGAPVANSGLDAPLFYQLMIGEMELRSGQPGTAYEVMLDAARRTRDEALFRRAVDIALGARAGDQALAAARAWRQVAPNSVEASRYQVQILLALNRLADAHDPLRDWLAATPAAQRPALINSLPGLLARMPDRSAAADLLERLLTPYRSDPATRGVAGVAQGRAWLAAGQAPRALTLARAAQAEQPQDPSGALLALDLMGNLPEAERVVLEHLALPQTEPALRLAYVRQLTQAQRYPDAVAQLAIVTRSHPQLAPPWLSLGALQLELRQTREAEQALRQFLALPAQPDDEPEARTRLRTQAQLLLAQAAEQRGDDKAAEALLAAIDSPQQALEVQARRASLMARNGKLNEARELLRKLPERGPEDARAKLLAEVQLLREAKRWSDAGTLLVQALQRSPDDTELAYETAMVMEKLERFDEMERLLRHVIAQKADHAHAHNALGYSLADRRVRLPEARALIERALQLMPGDPFITDSLGWVAFRMGQLDEAQRLLRQAWGQRPDAEIGAHLGEVLWALGLRDEARRIWQQARERDTRNEVLRETLARLRVGL